MSEVSEEEIDRAVVTLDVSQLADRQTRMEPYSQSESVTSSKVEQGTAVANLGWDSNLNVPLHCGWHRTNSDNDSSRDFVTTVGEEAE